MIQEPFKHQILRNFAQPERLNDILRRWPENGWKSHEHKYSSGKRSISELALMPESARSLIAELNSPGLVAKFSEMIGAKLIPDPWFPKRLWGGGLHEIERGGFLGMHVDFNVHPENVYRRANLLLYLNRNWEWGGALQLTDELESKVVSIRPEFNTAVLFETSEKSWHGHPEPLDCPDDVTRKSIAVYYYTREGKPNKAHSTIYREWPLQTSPHSEAK